MLVILEPEKKAEYSIFLNGLEGLYISYLCCLTYLKMATYSKGLLGNSARTKGRTTIAH